MSVYPDDTWTDSNSILPKQVLKSLVVEEDPVLKLSYSMA